MDEFKIKLSTRFMRNIVSKLIARAIRKKLGYKVDIQLNDLDVMSIDGNTTINVDAKIKMNSIEFRKLLKDIEEKDSDI